VFGDERYVSIICPGVLCISKEYNVDDRTYDDENDELPQQHTINEIGHRDALCILRTTSSVMVIGRCRENRFQRGRGRIIRGRSHK
jgi:hypothetical protein